MTNPQQLTIVRIRKLIWLYFFLLIFEGALRKWIAPSLSSVLLIIRDPVVIGIYYYAFKLRIFPRNGFVMWGGLLALLSLIAGLCAEGNTSIVAIYGFRANFLHWPLVFIIPRLFGAEDVKRVGYWILLLAIPLAALMALQFMSSSGSWLNAGANADSVQLAAAGGRIRPAATFSYVAGVGFYFTMVAAYLFHSQLSRVRYPTWLVSSSALALVVAVAVSGSRSLLASVAIVTLLALVAGFVLQPTLMFRWLWAASMLCVILFASQSVPFMQQGVDTFVRRINDASNAEGGAGGFADRLVSSFTKVGPMLYESPLLGYGLGKGTNVGAQLLGMEHFELAEEEWSRVVLESGPVLGPAFLLWRLCLTGWLCWLCLQRAVRGEPLPLLLFGVCSIGLINGQIGIATSQGFITFATALCLCAINCTSPVALNREKSKSGISPLQTAPGRRRPIAQRAFARKSLRYKSGM